MRAKAWLFSQGHIKSDGRGRMPLTSTKTGESITEILSKAKDSGVSFADWPKGEVTKSEKTGDLVVKRSASMSNTKTIPDVPPETYPEDKFTAYEFVNGNRKRVGMREVCNNCRVSLSYHWCSEPTYLGDRRVYIEPMREAG